MIFKIIFQIFELLFEEESGNAEVQPASNRITNEGNALSKPQHYCCGLTFAFIKFSKPLQLG
jgi:hypothetical protein